MGERCGAGTHPSDKPEEERNELLGGKQGQAEGAAVFCSATKLITEERRNWTFRGCFSALGLAAIC